MSNRQSSWAIRNPQSAIRNPQSAIESHLDKIAQILQFNGEVDVVDHDLLGHLQHDGREVQDSGNATADQLVGHLLGGGSGHGDNGHAHAAFPHDVFQLFDRINRLLDLLVASAIHVDVEGGDDLESFLLEPAVGQESQAEVADSDQDHRLQ